jgi:hypothetical protein
MCTNPRNRLVVFRLSQDEYLRLKAASEVNGARNISDFTRNEVLNCLNLRKAPCPLSHNLGSMEQSMAELQASVLRLELLLEGAGNVKRAAQP